MHLTDCFMELIAYVSYFRKTLNKRQPAFEQVRADIMRLMTQSEDCLKKGLFTRDDYDTARFAVCAWVDEAILGSSWRHKEQWQRELLQRIFYNTAAAGEEFFERLNALGPHQRDVREVYYLCLALGFMGRYCRKEDEYLLEQLKTSNLKLLAGSSLGVPSLEMMELFPEARPSGQVETAVQKPKFRFSLFTAVTLAAPVLLFGLLFLIYTFSLRGIGESFLSSLPK